MANLFETVNLLAVLAAGRQPQWVLQGGDAVAVVAGGGTGTPTPLEQGLTLNNAIVTYTAVALRPDPSRRVATTTVTTLDLTGTYRVTVNLVDSDFDASAVLPSPPTTLSELLEAWAAYLNADVGVNGVIVAEAVDQDGDGAFDVLVVRGISEADYSFAAARLVGTGALLTRIDPVTAKVRVFVRSKGPNAPPGVKATPPEGGNGTNGWYAPNGGAYTITTRNFVEAITTAGMANIYGAVEDVQGNPADASLTNGTLLYSVWVSFGTAINELEGV